MDGVVHRSTAHSANHKTLPKHKSASTPRVSSSHQAIPARRHKPQRSETLMRHAVAKPAHRHKPEPQPAPAHDQRTAGRLERARTIKKSHHIKRFPIASHPAHRAVAKKHVVVPVEKSPPAQTPTPPAPVSQSEALIANALKNARSHESTRSYNKKPRRRLTHNGAALGALAALLLVGFFTYQNIPSLSMRLAATRAGFNASLPGYQPSGFTQDRLVKYSPGKVSVSFHSNSDQRRFQLTQQVSNWNSQALVDNYLSVNDKPYQTFEANGKTIYIYDEGNATWVNGGVWYQIEGKSSLSSDQILQIANSI